MIRLRTVLVGCALAGGPDRGHALRRGGRAIVLRVDGERDLVPVTWPDGWETRVDAGRTTLFDDTDVVARGATG